MNYRVVFHVNQDDPGPVKTALHNIENLLKALQGRDADICILANGPAVKQFTRSQPPETVAAMQALSRSRVSFLLCRNAMNGNSLKDEDILPFADIVPAGIVALIDMQNDGFAYIKP